jgi:signal recognition particle subunit SRP54
MFTSLSNSITGIFDRLRGKGYITEDDLGVALREIRIALLEADVALPVVKDFILRVKEKAIGAELIKSITPGQLIVKIVSDELVTLLTYPDMELNLQAVAPVVIMMVGLQGSGKTTTSAKLALRLRQKLKKKVLVASLDTYRPAAQEQLTVLAKEIGIDCLAVIAGQNPVQIAKRAFNDAQVGGYEVLILDTAGRLHTDSELIAELKEIKAITNPTETILVADSLTGQDAVNIALEFKEKVGITGIVLTRVDGDARGGAALSMSFITKCPIKFLGMGERPADLEEFHADRVASRILGMGDVVSLVEQASEAINRQDAEKLAKKLEKGKFDLDDMLAQFKTLRRMGGIGKLVNFIPGMGKMKDALANANMDEKVLGKQEAIICAMTKLERRNPFIIHASRKKRIASGSGTRVEDVNRLLKQFEMICKAMKQFGKMSPSEMAKLEKMVDVRR